MDELPPPHWTMTSGGMEAWNADQMREYGRARERAAYERARHIVRTYKVSVGNSAAGEMACEWTMDALKEIDDAISALGADK